MHPSLHVGNAYLSVYTFPICAFITVRGWKKIWISPCLGFWTWQPIVHCSHCCILSLPLGSSHKQPRPKSSSSKKVITRPVTVPSGRLTRLADKHTVSSANKRVATPNVPREPELESDAPYEGPGPSPLVVSSRTHGPLDQVTLPPTTPRTRRFRTEPPLRRAVLEFHAWYWGCKYIHYNVCLYSGYWILLER